MSFSTKVVLITGGGSGIGEAAAIAFAKEGATVVIVDRDEVKAGKVAKKIEAYGVSPTVLTVDLCDDRAVKTTVETIISLHEKIDVLFNCAGILRQKKLLEDGFINTYDEVMSTNLRAMVLLTHLVSPHLIETKGNIINMASIAGISVQNGRFSAYCISKAGVLHFTKIAAIELGPKDVRVNSISPGAVNTNILENGGISLDLPTLNNATLLGGVIDPDEIADLVVYLASKKAKSITGSNYVIDRGTVTRR